MRGATQKRTPPWKPFVSSRRTGSARRWVGDLHSRTENAVFKTFEPAELCLTSSRVDALLLDRPKHAIPRGWESGRGVSRSRLRPRASLFYLLSRCNQIRMRPRDSGVRVDRTDICQARELTRLDVGHRAGTNFEILRSVQYGVPNYQSDDR